MARQPSSPELNRSTLNAEEISMASISAKQTLQGRQIDKLIDNQKILHDGLTAGFERLFREMKEDREARQKENIKTRNSGRLWSTLGTGAIVTILRVSWERLVDAWHALIR
jgi:hypothetical protein